MAESIRSDHRALPTEVQVKDREKATYILPALVNGIAVFQFKMLLPASLPVRSYLR